MDLGRGVSEIEMKTIYFSKQKKTNENYLDHTIELNCPLELCNHEIGLIDLTGRVQSKDEKKKTPLYLCCDICEESNVMNSSMPVIRQIMRGQAGNITNNMTNIIWLKVTRNFISKIRLYIADVDGNLQSLSNCLLNGTLGFKHEETHN